MKIEMIQKLISAFVKIAPRMIGCVRLYKQTVSGYVKTSGTVMGVGIDGLEMDISAEIANISFASREFADDFMADHAGPVLIGWSSEGC